MGLGLGDELPNVRVTTTRGEFHLHDWIGDRYCLLFAHPRDYTPICTTELACLIDLHDNFRVSKIKIIGLSCDNVKDHEGWARDIMYHVQRKGDIPFPIIADPEREIARRLNLFDPKEKDPGGMPLTCRAVYLISPQKRIKASILYPATTGRNFKEIKRIIEDIQFKDKQRTLIG